MFLLAIALVLNIFHVCNSSDLLSNSRRPEVGICIRGNKTDIDKIDCLNGTKIYCCAVDGSPKKQKCCEAWEFAAQHKWMLLLALLLFAISCALFTMVVIGVHLVYKWSKQIEMEEQKWEQEKTLGKKGIATVKSVKSQKKIS